MNKEKEIESAIRQLMATCEKHQVTMTGVIDDNDLGLWVLSQNFKQAQYVVARSNVITTTYCV
ncbi:hypothetical protein [uncultured Vibrio sp.]|uniref:hypothetical protein n=1 Tax=uncultured Vibrio sp. TaxID=114054 RepID=UPI002627FC63|nr:hypothetical protein [uncultured Vibrio sp.]